MGDAPTAFQAGRAGHCYLDGKELSRDGDPLRDRGDRPGEVARFLVQVDENYQARCEIKRLYLTTIWVDGCECSDVFIEETVPKGVLDRYVIEVGGYLGHHVVKRKS